MTAPHDEAQKEPAGEQRLDVVVVGGSQAGLAMAWHLAQQGRRFVVLEAAPELGHTWRSRWDSLKLFTPAQYDALPGMAFPAPADTYPTKDPVADYLQADAKAFDCPSSSTPRPPSSGGWMTEASRSAPPMPPTWPGRSWWPPARSRSPSSPRRPPSWTPR
jgi:choline dehydrogenase-like flavoprotein